MNNEELLRHYGIDEPAMQIIRRFGSYAELLRSPLEPAGVEDQLDYLVNMRMTEVRNELRRLGWEGPRYGTLTLGVAVAHFDFRKSASGCNNLGYCLNVIPDYIEESAAEFAARVHATVNTRCGECGALLVRHDTDHVCRQHWGDDGRCTVCGRERP